MNPAFEISDEGFESVLDSFEVGTDSSGQNTSRTHPSVKPNLEGVPEDVSESEDTQNL